MRKIFAAALVSSLIAGGAPAFAEGDYLIGARTVSPAWTQPAGYTPAAEASRDRRHLSGGDDQYVIGPTASAAWARQDDRLMLAAAHAPSAGNFLLASQGE
ncbi:hypothetical protein J8J14_02545 [Roseomonas sp. SSH11]|uniref:Uncharacterized protein n=1 Tax=Pararoseomonas baculiformis TaxID=2820812 RepID=A0ABS4A9G9_9PROT|nr:hypothetical protein [Pararoseomonas baculiformis]MBP0443646.1 hypothetical protein [Pararoseomonas baculiformis]